MLLVKQLVIFVGIAILSLLGLVILLLGVLFVLSFLNQGVTLQEQGKYQEAIDFYDMILKIFPRSSSALLNRGLVLKKLGRLEESLASYDRALKIQPKNYNGWNDRGSVLKQMERFEEAIDSYDRALKLQPEKPELWNNRALVLHKMERFEEAIDSYDRALAIKEEAMIFTNRGMSLSRLNKYEEAVESLHRSLDCQPTILTLLNFGKILIILKDYEQAIKVCNRALGIESQSLITLEQVKNYYVDNPPPDLIGIPKEQRTNIQSARIQEVNFLKEFALAKLAHENGHVGSAIFHYYQSISAAEWSIDLEPRKDRDYDLFQSIVATTFLNLIDALIETDRLEEAIKMVEKTKGRKLNEQFKDFTHQPFRSFSSQDKFTNFLNQMYSYSTMENNSKSTTSATISFEEIKDLLPSYRTVLIEWFIGEREIYVFIVTKNSYLERYVKVLSVSKEEILNWFRGYDNSYSVLRKNILNNDQKSILQQEERWDKNLLLDLEQLSNFLCINNIIDYINCAVPDCDSLIIVPHLFLHLLPLHALPFGSEGSTLLDRFPNGIRYFPSCSLLKLVQVRSARWTLLGDYRVKKELESFLAFQNPTTNIPGLDELKYSQIEVETIKKFFSNYSVFEKNEATKEKFFTTRSQDKNCIHFSCHGFFSYNNPLESSLMMANRQRITLADITLQSLFRCYLVTLAACESGMTDFSKITDEVIGLPSGFLIAGARTVVSSLWLVDDLPTALLMIKFYENLTREESINSEIVSIALNQSQQWLRRATIEEMETWIEQLPLDDRVKFYLIDEELPKRGSPDNIPFANPYYWAAFCTIG